MYPIWMLGSTVDFLTMMYYNVFTIREGEQMNINTVAEYLYANSIPVADVYAPLTGGSIHDHPSLTVNDNITVVLGWGKANVVYRDEDGVKVTDNTDSYISIVAGVKSFLPKRGGGNIQPAGWN